MARREKVSVREKMRQQLKERTQESHKRRDDSGNIKTFFDTDKMSDVPTWWAGKGDHIIDIIPYIAGSKDPRNSEGDSAYVLDIDVHRYVGPMDEMVVCLEQYGTPCPICEESRRLNREGADWKEVIKPLKPSRRVVYNVVVRDGGEMEKKDVQVLEIAHWFMERHLSKIAKDPRGGGFTIFSDPDEGRSISFARTGVGSENTQYEGHRFLDRDEPISDPELDAAWCLDALIEIKSYQDIHDIFFGTSPTTERVEEPPEVADVDEDEPEEELPEKPKRTPKRKQTAKLECPAGGTIGEDLDELEECDNCPIYKECEEIGNVSF